MPNKLILNTILGVLIILLLIVLLVYVVQKPISNICYKLYSCNHAVPTTIKNIFIKYNIRESNNDHAKKILSIPCSYDEPLKEIAKMNNQPGNYYFIIDNIDQLVGKNFLWINLEKFYGDKATLYVPPTFITYKADSMDKFKKMYDKNKLYIMKKNIQRQEGIKITSDYNELLNGFSSQFVVIQELLQNPYLIGGRKINLRVYVLIVVKNNNLSAYVYNDGFMYYTPKLFKKHSLDKDENITTGYIDRKVYEENPLTHQDFKNLIGFDDATIIFYNVRELIKNVLIPYQTLFTQQTFNGSTQFQIIGADVAVNSDRTTVLMEMNKGPDLSAKDERDSKLKHNLVEDMFDTLGIIKSNRSGNQFIQII